MDNSGKQKQFDKYETQQNIAQISRDLTYSHFEKIQFQTKQPKQPPKEIESAQTGRISKEQIVLSPQSCIRKRWKVLALSLSLVTIFLIGIIFLVIKVQFSEPYINTYYTSERFKFKDGSLMRITKQEIQKKYMIESNIKFELSKLQPVYANSSQQYSNSGQSFMQILLETKGILIQVKPNKSIQLLLDPKNFTNYLYTNFQWAANLTQEIRNQQIKLKQAHSMDNSSQYWINVQQMLLQRIISKIPQIESLSFDLENYLQVQYKENQQLLGKIQNDTNLSPSMGERKKLLARMQQKVSVFVIQVVQPIIKLLKQTKHISTTDNHRYLQSLFIRNITSLAQKIAQNCIILSSQELKCNRRMLRMQNFAIEYKFTAISAEDFLFSNLISGGYGFIQIGDWRFGICDRANFCFAHRNGNVAAYYFYNGYQGRNRRSDIWGKKQEKISGIKFLDRCIQFLGIWRLCQWDHNHLSLGCFTGYTSVIWRVDGTRHNGPRTTANGFALNRNSNPRIEFGDKFIKIGYWKIGDVNSKHMSIGTETLVADIYRYDGTIHTGPRMDFRVLGPVQIVIK